ncbi:hypothetical protein E4U61_003125 [Claviceps capensis]|nr:hypothetical protein E4U61_003125 [Claviceps capensis]
MLPRLLLLSPLLSTAQAGAALPSERGDQSICDFYAAKNYGENNATTQLKLMQGIVAYAYAGGRSLPDGDVDSSGIFNAGRFDGQNVDLRPWFDGSKATSNNNDQAVKIQWMDGGGTTPLLAFINGSTPMANIQRGTNQYKLFTHWYFVFGRIYSCSLYKKFLDSSFEPLNPAYVHKFMGLNQTQVGYFIDQLLVASRNFGFSTADLDTLGLSMNAKYNARCLPPIEDSLTSICLAKECPVAVPSPNCLAYTNVKQRGLDSSAAASSASSSSSSSTGSSSWTGQSGSATSSSTLSTGTIAGIAIGSAAVLLLAVGMVLFFCRRNRRKADSAPAPAAPAPAPAPDPAPAPTPAMAPAPAPSPSPAGFPPPQYGYGPKPHESWYAPSPHESYCVPYGHGTPLPHGWAEAKTRPEELAAYTPVSSSPPPVIIHTPASPVQYRSGPEMTQLAEMESPEPPAGWNSVSRQRNGSTS